MTVSEVSRIFNVSTRMLRYYENIGLILSHRKEDYAYRIYDETAVRRLQQIIILRKLRIPLKQIAIIFEDTKQVETLEILRGNLAELENEITALVTIKDIISVFVSRLNINLQKKIKLDLLQDADLIKVIDALSLSKVNFKEERVMQKLNNESNDINVLKNVRIVLLPPCTVASYHYIGENPEEAVGEVMSKFIQDSKLYDINPDARLFGFNHPNPSEQGKHYGYEDWITIPDDFEVPTPLVKKHFAGGLYAAHSITFPDFHEWKYLTKWVKNNDKYIANYSEQGDEIMGGCLEEHLNWVYSAHIGWPKNGIDGMIDLLLPIKLK